MKKYLALLLGFALAFMIGCASAPEPQKAEPAPAPKLPDISAQNKQLADASIGGFAYKSSKLDQARWDKWAKNSAPLVQEIINAISDLPYTLWVVGHADGSGPEEPVGDKPGNIKISTDRAKTVFDALKNAGINSPKIKYKGVGSDELLPDYDPKGAEQRRVTFQILPE